MLRDVRRMSGILNDWTTQKLPSLMTRSKQQKAFIVFLGILFEFLIELTATDRQKKMVQNDTAIVCRIE